MAIRIEDGKGNGNMASVSSDNKLDTRAVTEREGTHASESGNTFGIDSGELAVTATGGRMLWLQNTDTSRNFKVDRIWLHWNGGDTNYNRVVYGNIYVGDTEPDTNTSAGGTNNMNTSSGKAALMDVLYWDGVSNGMTGHAVGTQMFSFCVSQGTDEFYFDGALIIGPNDTLSINLNGNETGKANINIIGHYVSSDYHG